MPADGGRVEKNLRTLHRGEARGFGIPLIPADQHTDLAITRLPRFETKVAGREIEFLVEQRIIRNVHLAIDAEQRTVGINDRSGVVINAGRALLKQRGDDGRLCASSRACGGRRCWDRESFRPVQNFCGLALAEILRTKKFLRADDLRAGLGGAFDEREGLLEVRGGIGGTVGLDQS